MKEESINCTIEAMIMASPDPVSIRRINDILTDVNPARIRQAIGDLNNVYMGCGSSFRIREVAGGYQFYILPDFERVVKELLTKERTVRLTQAALESLAIIAYKQPVTKTEIEHIRGVASDGVLHNLLQHKLIAIAGRADAPGRPLLYKTSDNFLKFFGLNKLSDLPRMDEIEEMIRQAEGPREQTQIEFGQDQGAWDTQEEFENDFEYQPDESAEDDQPEIEPEDEEMAPDSGTSEGDDFLKDSQIEITADDTTDTEEAPAGDNGHHDLKESAAHWLEEYQPIPDFPLAININTPLENGNGNRLDDFEEADDITEEAADEESLTENE